MWSVRSWVSEPLHIIQRVHPAVMWAKLETLVEGAALATKELWS
ncbi:hypothetical protein [Candidatus Entotheonella palauensis]|nr:hypothetical protein [Candidatus Entotheonella palauensis]